LDTAASSWAPGSTGEGAQEDAAVSKIQREGGGS